MHEPYQRQLEKTTAKHNWSWLEVFPGPLSVATLAPQTARLGIDASVYDNSASKYGYAINKQLSVEGYTYIL